MMKIQRSVHRYEDYTIDKRFESNYYFYKNKIKLVFEPPII